MTEQLTLAELAERSGTPARTIRFYISRGLLPGPVKGGRAAAYTSAHLDRLEEIRQLQSQGRPLSEIAARLGSNGRPTVEPAAWWQFKIADDVVVWSRADVSPWRMKEIRAAIDEMASRLTQKEKE